jgi:hypothetical protein
VVAARLSVGLPLSEQLKAFGAEWYVLSPAGKEIDKS